MNLRMYKIFGPALVLSTLNASRLHNCNKTKSWWKCCPLQNCHEQKLVLTFWILWHYLSLPLANPSFPHLYHIPWWEDVLIVTCQVLLSRGEIIQHTIWQDWYGELMFWPVKDFGLMELKNKFAHVCHQISGVRKLLVIICVHA